MIYICRSAAVDLAAAFSPPVCEKKIGWTLCTVLNVTC